MRNKVKQNRYKTFERNGQLILALNTEKTIPENAPVQLRSIQLEELGYSELYGAYSSRGGKSAVDVLY